MFKSVFAKFMTVFVIIIVVSFTILATVTSSLVHNIANERIFDKVYRTTEDVKALLEVGSETYDGNFISYLDGSKEELEKYFSKIDNQTQETIIFVTDLNGKIILSNVDLSESTIDSKIIDEIVSEGEYKGEGNLNSLLSDDNYIRALSIELNGDTVGSIFVCTVDRSAVALAATMVKTIIMTSMWIMLATLIAVYIITERITVPLRAMSKAAKSFSEGQFDVRVPVIGKDEVAQLATAFNNMAGSLASYEENRRTFLANVSHDLRTPMFNISGFIESILSGAVPKEEEEKYLKIIKKEVQRLSRLVSSLLDISRIQAGDRKFEKTPFDICEMARQILISFEQKIEDKKLDVSFECEDDKMYVLADRDAIYQILYNICDNAVKFSRDEGKYQITLKRKDKSVYVTVYNEGEGIPKEDVPHVFDRFYKADKSRGLDKTGTGLGLFIAKTIIDAHNENIWVDSVEGEYCEFTFTIIQSSEQAFQAYQLEQNKKKK